MSDPVISPSNNDLPSANVPPALSAQSSREFGSMRSLFAILLSLCLAFFLVDAAVSLADDTLILFCGIHALSTLRGLISFLALLMAVAIYGLIGLTPMVPKRLFLPIPLFALATLLGIFPFAIYCFGRLEQIGWGISLCQVVVGLGILYWSRGGLNFRWPLVPVERLGTRGFSWLNLSGFVLVNVLVLLPAVVAYVFLCAALAVNHFSEGFMALRPGGFSVQVRKYVRDDGKTIELFPMSHVADARFYQRISQTFPTNSVILMEGVTDENNLLTNRISYRRMAKSLGLTEQRREFVPRRGRMVAADVDVDQFSPDTIGFLNLVILVQTDGLTPANLQKLLEYSPSTRVQGAIINDILTKRNQHLVGEIQTYLSKSDDIMVPWGVAHMPGIAKGIQKAGFRLVETHKYMVIPFGGHSNPGNGTSP